MEKPKASEVVDIFRQALSGDAYISLVRYSYPTLVYKLGSWKVSFFVDSNDIDYTELAVSPDERSSTYQDFADELGGSKCPLDILNNEERSRLEKLLLYEI